MKPKKCKHCKAEFIPARPLQIACGWDCAHKIADKKRINSDKVAQRAQKRELIAAKERIKSRADWIRETQQAVNAYIRARDKALGYGCISCGTRQGKENAGHYRSVGSCPELRFNEENIHLQCERCNTYLHSNAIAYRIALVQRIGLDIVEWLEGSHEAKHYSIEDLKELKQAYKAKLKGLQQ